MIIDKSDDWHRRLLCARRERPRESLSACYSLEGAGPAGQPSHIFHRRCAGPAPLLQWDILASDTMTNRRG